MAQEPDKALMQAAEKGDAEAQYKLAQHYECSHVNVNEGFLKAPIWYRKSADQGHVAAQERLALLYEMGKCVERNHEEAIRWYERAGKRSSAESLRKQRAEQQRFKTVAIAHLLTYPAILLGLVSGGSAFALIGAFFNLPTLVWLIWHGSSRGDDPWEGRNTGGGLN